MSEFCTSQEKREFMLLLTISIFVVNISVITVYFIVLDPPMYTAVTEFDWFYLREDNEDFIYNGPK